ncbi:MAG: poly(R)-hydroxyalkanoic acid synthase subunit PhaE [Steroidobacteraceae bacterium]
MTAPFGDTPDWWTLWARAPFAKAGFDPNTGGGGGSADPVQQFLAACEQHMGLMQAYASAAGQGAHGDAAPLLERLAEWQRGVAAGNADPFAFLRSGGFGVPTGHAQVDGLRRLASLQSRALELHARMLGHGADIAREAMQLFAARAASARQGLAPLYATWIDCAEEAYAARVHREDYCKTQAELTNTLNALRAEQRSQFEEWARLLDLPTRTELDALIRRVRALEKALAQRKPAAPRAPQRKARAPGPSRRTGSKRRT